MRGAVTMHSPTVDPDVGVQGVAPASGTLRRRPVDVGRPGRPMPGAGWAALTPRELEVVALVTRGATNQQTARRLRCSPHTVSTHLRHVFVKLGVTSRVELTRIVVARQLG